MAKDEQGLPLTGKEEELLAELYRRKYERRRDHIHVDAQGTVHVQKTVDAEPIMDAVKAYGDFIDKYTTSKRAQRIVGALDPVTAFKWMQETGLKIGTKEFAQFAMKRIKTDNEYRRFKVGH